MEHRLFATNFWVSYLTFFFDRLDRVWKYERPGSLAWVAESKGSSYWAHTWHEGFVGRFPGTIKINDVLRFYRGISQRKTLVYNGGFELLTFVIHKNRVDVSQNLQILPQFFAVRLFILVFSICAIIHQQLVAMLRRFMTFFRSGMVTMRTKKICE